MPPTAYIALGANTGDRRANLSAALASLNETEQVSVIKVSDFLENPAVGGPPDSPPFLNAAAEIETTLPPADLLARMLDIEQSLGRIRREKWGPRPIDLDLLLFADQIIHQPGLSIPHPLMHQRSFVLQPLAQIAPQAIHPVLNKTIRQLLHDLPGQDRT
jgi:2-amino-4-hydroxy-6-hydroxymethyldihydropteridine diphosphokinase